MCCKLYACMFVCSSHFYELWYLLWLVLWKHFRNKVEKMTHANCQDYCLTSSLPFPNKLPELWKNIPVRSFPSVGMQRYNHLWPWHSGLLWLNLLNTSRSDSWGLNDLRLQLLFMCASSPTFPKINMWEDTFKQTLIQSFHARSY